MKCQILFSVKKKKMSAEIVFPAFSFTVFQGILLLFLITRKKKRTCVRIQLILP